MPRDLERLLISIDVLGGSAPTPYVRYTMALIRLLITTSNSEMLSIAPNLLHWADDLEIVIDEARLPRTAGYIYASDAQAVVLHLQAHGLAADVDTTAWRSPRQRGGEYLDREHVWLIAELGQALFRELLEGNRIEPPVIERE